MIYRLGAAGSAVLGGIAVATVVGVSWYAFDALGWLVDPIYPAIALTAVYLTGTLFVFLRTERERNRVRHAFGHYMAPALVERLADDPSRLKLGGETRDMTLLFSDVRGFTAISEGLDAEELTYFLNSLFTPLSKIILDEQGTIDKFMGDAVMAFWNAPLDDSEHATHACSAALTHHARMPGLNEHWRKEAEAKGRPFSPVKIGIGLNTGICCVGNLGSETRFDYSVIGDNVNIASRLEGQSKTYDVGTIVGESTTARAPDFAFLELDLLKVKGKSEATRIFALSAMAHSSSRAPSTISPPVTPSSWNAIAPRIGTRPRRSAATATGSTPRASTSSTRSTASASPSSGRTLPRPTGTGPQKPSASSPCPSSPWSSSSRSLSSCSSMRSPISICRAPIST